MSTPPLYTTPAGFRRLQKRIAAARRAYLDVCATNEDAAGSGDSSVWHDNFAYEENQRQMHQLAARVAELERAVAAMHLVPPASAAPNRVRVGCRVTVTFLDDDSTRLLYVAGFDDGDPKQGRVSYTAPLARVLLGAEEGDVRSFRHAGRERDVEITELLPAPAAELQ